MYNAFWTRVSDVLRASAFGRMFFCIVNFFSEAFKQSWFYSFFTKNNMADYGQASAISTFLRKLSFQSKLTDFVSQSVLVWIFSEMPCSVFASSVSLLVAYILPAGIVMFIGGFGNVTSMIISALIIMFGISLLGIKTSVGSVLQNSFVFKKVCDFFCIDTSSVPTKKYNKRLYVITSVFGLIVGALSVILSFNLSVVAFVAVLFLPLMIASPLLLITLTFICGTVLSSMPAFVLSLLTLIVVLCRIVKKMDTLPKLRTPYILVILYAFITFYFALTGYAGSDSLLAGIVQFVLITIFFSTVVTVNNYNKFKKLIFSLSSCTVFPSILGIYQMLTGQGGTGWTAEKYVGGLARISSTFANPNVYGEFLIFTICISTVAVLISKNIKERLIFLTLFVLEFINLALTYSRGCYISVAFALLIVVWCCDKRLLGFGVFVLPVIPYVLPKNILTRILSVGSYLKDSSVVYRFSIWRGSLKVIQNHWHMGAGVGTAAFMLFYNNYMIGGTIAQHAHNTFMQIAIELSLLGLIVFLLIILYSIKDVCNVVKTSVLKAKFMLVPLISAFAGISIQCFVDYIFYNNIVFMLYWLVLGLLVAGLNVVSSDEQFAIKHIEGV